MSAILHEIAQAVARAGMGCMYYVVGHGRSGLWGALKEVFVLCADQQQVPAQVDGGANGG